MLEDLKKLNGPFTNPDEVTEYIHNHSIGEKDKKQRLKKEIQFYNITEIPAPFFLKVTSYLSAKLHFQQNSSGINPKLNLLMD